MEPSRKRPFVDDEDLATAKKRVLTGPNGSPHVNGLVSEPEEPHEANRDNLELFRKEAIFRRMRHYSREHERSKYRIAQLERRKHTCEAGLTVMAACWNQLVKTIRLLVNLDDFPEVADDMFNVNVHILEDSKYDFTKTLQENMNATQTLVTRLIKAGGDSQLSLSNDDALTECQKANADRISLQSQLELIRAQLVDTENQKEQYHSALVTAENRLDRLRSNTVAHVESRMVDAKQESPEDVIEESQRKPSSPAGFKSPGQTNGTHDLTELEILREQLTTRETRIVELEREVASIREDKTHLEGELRMLSYDRIAENPHYKGLLDHSGYLQTTANESRQQNARLLDELNNLRTSRKDWEEEVLSAANQTNQELKAMLAKRDSENARLREQRDQQGAELTERRQHASVKIASSRELKALADSRAERIIALESEVGRCKALLAAHAGQEEIMAFFLNGRIEEVTYFETLKSRVTTAESRALALEQSLSKYREDNPDVAEHIAAEADALQKLFELQNQLEKYKTIYGDRSTDALEITAEELLRQKEEQLQKLRLMDIQHTQAETSLYAELDKLSAAWESLDRQVKDKVFDLSTIESQLKKAAGEKAKSDNKYFSTMREKDALSAEHTKLVREVEKQNKVVERLVDIEKNLTAQLATLEKELGTAKNINFTYKDKVDTLNTDIIQLSQRYSAEKRRLDEAVVVFQEQEKAHAAKRIELRRLEDGFIRSKKELEHKIKQRDVTAAQDDVKESEQLMKLLKCSTCQTDFRNTVITKCMHTFCKTCVDARISTRQRKCPACSLAFSQSDVLQIYFQ